MSPTSKSKAQAAALAVDEAAGKPINRMVAAQLAKTKMCAMFARGQCRDPMCTFAHSRDELRTVPNLQKTAICRAFLAGKCDNKNCRFAHGEKELRVTRGVYKTQLCNFFERGHCKKGSSCRHAHGLLELRAHTEAAEAEDATNLLTQAAEAHTKAEPPTTAARSPVKTPARVAEEPSRCKVDPAPGLGIDWSSFKALKMEAVTPEKSRPDTSLKRLVGEPMKVQLRSSSYEEPLPLPTMPYANPFLMGCQPDWGWSAPKKDWLAFEATDAIYQEPSPRSPFGGYPVADGTQWMNFPGPVLRDLGNFETPVKDRMAKHESI